MVDSLIGPQQILPFRFNNGNEGILHITQSSRTRTLPSDSLVSSLGHSSVKCYFSAEMQLVYSTALVNWAATNRHSMPTQQLQYVHKNLRKHHALINRNIVLLYDNERPHTARIMQEKKYSI